MTSTTTQQQQSPITLPEIDVSNHNDWDEISFLSSPPPQQLQDPPSPPSHQTESDSSESITTGLTRALSLPRQLNKTTTSKEEEENIRKEVINISTSNPSHLFWVPASQHPEIAPAEFEKYVDTHGLMIRKKSVKRRQSVLSVYFTASDQQKLFDEMAKNDTERDRQATLDALESSNSNGNIDNGNRGDEDEERKRRLVIRRSVSLHLPTTGDYVRNVPDLLVFDRNSSPLDQSRALVPKGDRPLLRRGARTNFKRNSSVTAPNRPQLINRKSESDYINEQKHQSVPISRSSSADGGVTLQDGNKEIFDEEESSPLSPVAETEEVRDLCIATRDIPTANVQQPPQPQPVASPSSPAPIVMSRSASTSIVTTTSSRKSAWSWAFWSDEKSSKKNNKIDPVEQEQAQQPVFEEVVNNRQPQVSKSSDTTTTTSLSSGGGSSGKRFTLSSLFSRKSKNSNNVSVDSMTANLTKDPPKDFQLNRMYMTRLPLHVERAIYKLSHIKLANPRRPLHEQVLISNQMFWYLSVIATNAPQPTDQPHHHHQPQQQKKKPRKLVKKQRPPPPQKQHHKKDASSKLTNNVIIGGYMGNNSSREASTGFVVPENYLNPKYQKQQQKPAQQQQPKQQKNNNGLYQKEWDHKQSDSSSDDDDDDDDEEEDDEEEEEEEVEQKEDDVPLALYKTNSHRVK